MKKITKKKMLELKLLADKIQPDALRDERCKDMSKTDTEVYDSFNAIYKDLCDEDKHFHLTFMCPESSKSFIFFRYADIEDQIKYRKAIDTLLWTDYTYLSHTGYLKELEKLGYIKILEKDSPKFKENT